MIINKPEAIKIALLSNINIELLSHEIIEQFSKRNINVDQRSFGFGQFVQDILYPGSDLYNFSPDFVFLYIEGEIILMDIVKNPFSTDKQKFQIANQESQRIIELCDFLLKKLPSVTIILNSISFTPINCLTGLEYNSPFSFLNAVEYYNKKIYQFQLDYPSIKILDIPSMISWIGYENWVDPRMYYLARSPWSKKGMRFLSNGLINIINGDLWGTKKCLILDLDNTLWGGVIGEDGVKGIKLGMEGLGYAFLEFQEEILNLSRKGILLAICSKNNIADVVEVMRNHPFMLLKEDHFSIIQANWDDKARNIKKIGEMLNIGLDSLVFIDDNPVERSWVKQALPDVIVPDWPKDPSFYKLALIQLEASYFFKTNLTEEDRERPKLYLAQSQRNSLELASNNIEDFYRSLEMEVIIKIGNANSITRIAQLTQKTNQFNLTTRRYTEAEISFFISSSDYVVLTLELNDRFGPSGIVGILICRKLEARIYIIDTFLLSCRVMGRTVENAFIATLIQYLREAQAEEIFGEYIPTNKNMPVKDLYSKLGFAKIKTDEHVLKETWKMDISKTNLKSPEWFLIKKEL